MRILIALDLNDDDLTEAYEGQPISWRDMRASLDARLEEATTDRPTLEKAIAEFCIVAKASNPHFNRSRFMAAAGLS
jgi:hypothetical protein